MPGDFYIERLLTPPLSGSNAREVLSTQGPDLSPALQLLLVDFYIAGALRLGDGVEFGDILGTSVTESHGPRIPGKDELDLEFTPVPACLRGVVMRVYHGVELNSNPISGGIGRTGNLAFFTRSLFIDRSSVLCTVEYQ